MEFNGWNSFEDFVRACGYTNCQNNCTNSSCDNNTNKTNNSSSKNNSSNAKCSDIPNGFQSLNPELFIVIGELLGNIIAGNLPFNVQNAIANWLELVGQTIMTYNAQQQYFQGGPGRYFNPEYYNVNNPFCGTNSSNTNQTTTSKNKKPQKSTQNNSNPNVNLSSTENEIQKIEALELRISQLSSEIEKIKNSMTK